MFRFCEMMFNNMRASRFYVVSCIALKKCVFERIKTIIKILKLLKNVINLYVKTLNFFKLFFCEILIFLLFKNSRRDVEIIY